MTIKASDYRWSALARYNETALDASVILLALARRPVHSHFDTQLFEVTSLRSDIRTMTEIQAFATNTRKSIEIANVVIPGLIDRARSGGVHSNGELFRGSAGGTDIALCERSFWWVVSRIIHSVSTVVLSEDEHLQSTATRIYSLSRKSIFGFASDLDEARAEPGGYVIEAKRMSYVRIERLIAIYCGLSLEIEKALDILCP